MNSPTTTITKSVQKRNVNKNNPAGNQKLK